MTTELEDARKALHAAVVVLRVEVERMLDGEPNEYEAAAGRLTDRCTRFAGALTGS